MIAASTFNDKSVAVFGLGGSGITTALALKAGGARVAAWDDSSERVKQARSAGIPVVDLQDADWSDFAALILSPGVPLTHPEPHWTVLKALAAGIEIIGDIELFVRERRRLAPDCAFVAITGTNGKSTTTVLISHILSTAARDVQMGGNIGTPVLELEPPQSDRTYVVECSSYQIDLAPGLDPSIGVHLNLSPDHLDRHGTIDHYASVKERLVTNARRAVVGIDDPHSAAIAENVRNTGREVIQIAAARDIENGIRFDGDAIFSVSDARSSKVASLKGARSLRGMHNAQNAATAYAVCQLLGLSDEEIQAGLVSFPGLAHRMEEVGRSGPLLFINDSKATNADAAARALASFDRIYWIAGGRAKSGGIHSLEEFFPTVAKAYLIGESAAEFGQTLQGLVPFEQCQTLEHALTCAFNDANKAVVQETAILLSPACASFDQFSSFEQRGDVFRAAVHALLNNPDGREVA
ncbi:MAG: UDP-N-acetylmuramoyl-L-alanine--D-glutamate ligase [Stappiaceae bacterium]